MKLNEVFTPQVDWNSESEAKQIAMVKMNGFAIRLIDKPSEAVQLAAVTAGGTATYYIKKKGIIPSEAVQMAAVTQNGFAIQHIYNPSEAVQLAAVNQNGAVIEFIKNPSNALIKVALTNQRLIDNEPTYKQAVLQFFKDNTILVNKWLRYGETMRNQQ